MNTALENGAVEAIKRGHHALREAIHTVLTEKESLADRALAVGATEAILPMLSALTGSSPDELKRMAITRLEADGRLTDVTV